MKKIFLIACVVTGGYALPLHAFVPQGVDVCTKITNDDKRLQCFDKLFALPVADQAPTVVSSENGAEFSPIVSTTVVPAPIAPVDTKPVAIDVSKTVTQAESIKEKISPQDAFGGIIPTNKYNPDVLDEMSFVVASVDKSSRGIRTFTMDNGQKWRESDTSSFRIKKGSKVVIKKGLMSAFYMQREGANRRLRVKRLK